MLPELPNLTHGQFPILQQWFGFASLLLVVFGIYVSIRKMNRDDRVVPREPPATQQSAIENVFSQVPKVYLDGPLVKMFELLKDIHGCVKRTEACVHRIEKSIDDWTEPDDDDRRRRR